MRVSAPFWMMKLRQLWRLVRESHANPLTGEPQIPPAPRAGTTAITFIGHSSFLIQMAGRAILIDPVFATRLILLRRQRRPGIRVADLPPIDAVLITHAHMDHLNLPSLRAICRAMRKRGLPSPMVIVPNGVEDLVRKIGFSQIHSLAWWQSFEISNPAGVTSSSEDCIDQNRLQFAVAPITTPPIGIRPITVTATPARHWGARMFKDTHRGFGGYLLDCGDGQSVYHSGDTAYFSGFAEIGRRLNPRTALLPIGAYYPDSYRSVHTSPEEALRAFLDLGADVMVPMHYNTFRLGREPMDEPLPRLLRAAEKAAVRDRIVPLSEGETLASESVTGAYGEATG